MAFASSHSGSLYLGTELSAVYRSDDQGKTWQELQTSLTLPSAKGWSFSPRPDTHHVQSILPDLADLRRRNLLLFVLRGRVLKLDAKRVSIFCGRRIRKMHMQTIRLLLEPQACVAAQ